MKKIVTLIITITLSISMSFTQIFAANSTTFQIDNYNYTFIQENNKNIVYVTDLNNNNTNTIIYNSTNNILYIDGKEEEFSFNIDIPDKSTRSIDSYGPLKVTFSVNFKDIGLLAGVILAVGTMATTVATCGVSTGLFGTAVKTIFTWYTTGDLASHVFPGAKVSGYFSYYLQHDNSSNLSRYANRSLTYRFGSGSYKTYNFGSGGWWSSTRPVY